MLRLSTVCDASMAHRANFDYHLPHRYNGLASGDLRKEALERGSIDALMSFKDSALRRRLPGPMIVQVAGHFAHRASQNWSVDEPNEDGPKKLLVAASSPECIGDG